MAEETRPASIDSIIGRIQEEIGRRKSVNGNSAPPFAISKPGGSMPPPPELAAAERALGKAEQTWRVGEQVPPMRRQSGPKRLIAQLVGKIVIRLAQLFTRDQREFNQATMT